MRGYRKRVERDLDRWREAGWVSPDGAAAIRADLAGRRFGIGLAPSLAILGAVLIGFAVMSFVGANWQEMPRVVRLGLLTASLWASYVLAGVLFARGMDAFAHAAALLGASVFGASIMLISQMYHIDGHPPDAVLVWAIGTLLAGVLLNSNPALAFAAVLFGVWGWMESADTSEVFWPYLLGWAATAAAFFWQAWKPGLHLSGIGLAGFLVSLGFLLNDGHAHEVVVLLGLAVIGASIAGERAWPGLHGLWPGTLGYGLVVAFCGLYALQFAEVPALGALVMLAVLTLVLALAAIAWGLARDHRGALWLGYIGFSAEILALYSKTVGTLLGSSLFFLVAGLIVIALAALAWRLHARQEALEART